MKKLVLATAFVIACLVLPVKVQAQYNRKSPAEILREAQERQQAIDQVGRDFQRDLSKILEDKEAQAERERQLQREEEQAQREEARLQRQREEEARQQQLQEQQQREDQEQLQRAREEQRERAAQQAQNGLYNGQAQQAQTIETRPTPTASSTENSGANEKGWSGWQSIFGTENDGGIDVRYRREGGAWISWDWQFRNRYNQPVVVRFTRLSGKGGRMKSWTPIEPQSLAPADTNMSGDVRPDVQITEVEFRRNQ